MENTTATNHAHWGTRASRESTPDDEAGLKFGTIPSAFETSFTGKPRVWQSSMKSEKIKSISPFSAARRSAYRRREASRSRPGTGCTLRTAWQWRQCMSSHWRRHLGCPIADTHSVEEPTGVVRQWTYERNDLWRAELSASLVHCLPALELSMIFCKICMER